MLTTSRKRCCYVGVETSRRCSEHDAGQVVSALRDFIQQCRMDPYALETVWVSIRNSGETVNLAHPVTELATITDRDTLTIAIAKTSRSTALASLIRGITASMCVEIVPRDQVHKGDFRPLVVLVIWGLPEDKDETAWALAEMRRAHRPHFCVIQIGERHDLQSWGYLTCESRLRADEIAELSSHLRHMVSRCPIFDEELEEVSQPV